MKVWHYKDPLCPADAKWIDRRNGFGNPFRIGVEGTRDEVCDKFEAFVARRPDLVARAKKELKGRDLKCHCKPARCHGDTWLRIAND